MLDLTPDEHGLTEYLFAYPYVNWVFTLGTPYMVTDNVGRITVEETRVLGPRTNFAEYLHPAGNLTFGITFQFGSTLSIFQEEIRELTNKVLLQDEILPSANWLTSFFRDTKPDVFMETLNDQIQKLYHASDQKGHILWKQFVALLVNGTNYSTSAIQLSKELGVSQRHLQRVTLKYSGLTPKQVQSMLRCRLAIRSIR